MIGTLAVLGFVAVDMAMVIAALLWLNERRSEEDRTDVRYNLRRRLPR